MKVKANVGFTMNEVINSESATQTIKDLAGKTVTLTGILFGEKVDSDGEIKNIAVIKTAESGLVTTISNTVMNALDTILNAYTDAGQTAEIEKGIKVAISTQKSGHNREFYILEVVA